MLSNNYQGAVYKIIAKALSIPPEKIKPDLSYQSIAEWNSIDHINLMVALEKELNITIQQDDVPLLSTVKKITSYVEARGVKLSIKEDVKKSPALNRGLTDVYIDETDITNIDVENAVLEYRGYSIDELIKNNIQYEKLVYLLLYKKFPTAEELNGIKSLFIKHRNLGFQYIEIIRLMTQMRQKPIDILRTIISALANSLVTLCHDEQLIAFLAKAPLILGYTRAFSQNVSLPVIEHNLSHAQYTLLMLLGYLPDKTRIKIYENKMLIQADHGLNASTLAARVCTSTNSDMGSSLTAAIATFSGPLHGGALLNTMMMLEEIDDISLVGDYIKYRLDRHLPIYGFGHRVYKSEDPRATYLKEAAKQLSELTNNWHWYHLLEAIKAEMTDFIRYGMNVNVDFYACVSYKLMGFDNNYLVPIFICNRIAGWGAHIIEQKENNILIRPKLKYVGLKNNKILNKGVS